jgi:hypothetical protein
MNYYGMTKAKSIDLPWGQDACLVAGFIFSFKCCQVLHAFRPVFLPIPIMNTKHGW